MRAFRISLSIAILSVAGAAQAQMMNNPWNFQPQNRASIASLMQQVENGGAGSAQVPSVTTLVCGGGGEAAASGNSTCVILNNAMGDVDVGQDSDGSQSATSSNTSVSDGPTDIDAIVAALNGDD